MRQQACRYALDQLRVHVGVGDRAVELPYVAQLAIQGAQAVGRHLAADVDDLDVPVDLIRQAEPGELRFPECRRP